MLLPGNKPFLPLAMGKSCSLHGKRGSTAYAVQGAGRNVACGSGRGLVVCYGAKGAAVLSGFPVPEKETGARQCLLQGSCGGRGRLSGARQCRQEAPASLWGRGRVRGCRIGRGGGARLPPFPPAPGTHSFSAMTNGCAAGRFPDVPDKPGGLSGGACPLRHRGFLQGRSSIGSALFPGPPSVGHFLARLGSAPPPPLPPEPLSHSASLRLHV